MTLIEATPSCRRRGRRRAVRRAAPPARADRAPRCPGARRRDRGRLPVRVVPAPAPQPPGPPRDRAGLARHRPRSARRSSCCVATGRELSLEAALEDDASRGRRIAAPTPAGATRAPRAARECIRLPERQQRLRVATCARAQLRGDRRARGVHDGARSSASSLRAQASDAADAAAASLKRRGSRLEGEREAGPTAPGRAYAGASRPGSACAASARGFEPARLPSASIGASGGGLGARAGARRAR